ncbi:hypothetical protein GLOIN_2v1511347 [Rhizophagus irregularis DAOM 181602=DAOM 197198]|nr:hypothetical protein GLOIN_2v1511347 [Rhizophagus irregularis DAOM 181602=DAOM 197198]
MLRINKVNGEDITNIKQFTPEGYFMRRFNRPNMRRDRKSRISARWENNASNLAQLESAFQTNKKKRTADQAFRNDYFDYLYGIMSTGTGWHFIMYTPDGIYSTSSSEYQINLTKSAIKKILITSKQREG